MNKVHIYLKGLLLVSCILHVLYSEAKKPNYMLGGGGTNFSGLYKPYLNRHGLRTGTYSDIHHLWGVFANGAYSTFFSSMPVASFKPGGYGVGGGVCYELQVAYFKMQIGAGVEWQYVTNKITDTTFYDSSVLDARINPSYAGYPYTLRYDFEQRKDRAWNLHVQMPILFGAGISNVYILAGIKLDHILNVGGTRVTAVGTTSATYPQYLGHFVEMDNHGLRKNVPLERQAKRLELKFDVLASLEIGAEWGKKLNWRPLASPVVHYDNYETRLRIALFVDYGLCDIMPNQRQDLLYIPSNYKWDFPEFQLHHAFSTKDAQSYKLHNFYAGIKLTALIGVYSNSQCILCNPAEPAISEREMSSPSSPIHKNPSDGTGRRRPYARKQPK